MINEMSRKINKINQKIGVNVRVPELSKKNMENSAVTNLIAGGAIATVGVLLERKELLLLGGLGLLGSLVLSIEAQKLEE
ncbi:hypothetical protein [Enterococcus termitis]|jgi:hypothetical protein|uniref:Uncharacterized protein n=1 Tax=Enterococcus termitis TaxID=332950 RepID=A0A1E5GK97_9ENTE|nr:hypothetical protein [Enterococcus termitis]OEG13061.1 hypothetical protein BCR25_06115 [Enterococcus termitis]OJG99086.1 hypothetical protein RV18_GL002240 [Enterococcus termitis]